MKPRRPKIKKGETGTVKIMAVGIGVSAAVSVGLAMLCAKLVLSGLIKEAWMGWAADGIILLSVLLGSLYIAGKVKKSKLPLGMACAGSYLVLAVVFHAMFLQRAYSNILLTCVCCAAGGLIGSLLGVKGKKKRRFG